MFILPGIVGLVSLIFLRPFEFIESLRGVPFLYVFFTLAVFGYLVDLRLGRVQLRFTPQWSWVLGFVAWCLLTLAIALPGELPAALFSLVILTFLFFVIAHGIQTFRAFELLAAVVLGCSLLIAGVCVHQGTQPFTCIAVAEGEGASSRGESDGRPCMQPEQCVPDSPDPELQYRCERAGIFGITSIGHGRVRYVGVLQDPNEVSLAIGVAVPLAFGFYERRRTRTRLLLLLGTVVLVGICVMMTQSRGGQLVFLAVLGAYFIKRYGWRGALLGAVASAPIMLLGGRGGEEADSSSIERLECWYEGMDMFRTHPLFGVGFDRFTDHHFLTAHNSFVLAPAELGFPGMMLWTALVFASIKIPWTALKRYEHRPEADVARAWAMALIASMMGMLAGVFFLSFNYHYVLWIWLGMAGAFYSAVRTHDPDFRVRLTGHDLAGLAVVNAVLIAAIFVYTRVKTGG